MADCIYCGRWELKDTDAHCAYCGRMPLNVVVSPDRLTLSVPDGQLRGELAVRNASGRAAGVECLSAEPLPPFLRLDPAEPFTLEPGAVRTVRLELLPERLPAGMRAAELPFRCRLDGSEGRCVPFGVRVVPGPQPAVARREIDFGKVERGSSLAFAVEVKNQGGAPFQVLDARVEASPDPGLRADWAPGRELPVRPGEGVSVNLVWERAETAPVEGTVLRLRLSHDLPDLTFPISARMVSYALAAEPPEVLNPCALSREEVAYGVRLRNTGTERVEVTGIESDRPWLRVFAPQAVFSLLPEGQRTDPVAGRSVFAGAFPFTVIAMPEQLPAGRHEGCVTVFTQPDDVTLRIPFRLDVRTPDGEYNHFVGIDFGTTNSCVAVWNEDRNTEELVPDPERANLPGAGASDAFLIPSYLVFKGGADQYDIGELARRQASIYPEQACRSLKRIMGHTRPRTICGIVFEPHQLAALLIKRLVRLAERRLFELSRETRYLAVRRAMLTVPADFYDAQVRGIIEAARLSGLDVAVRAGAAGAAEGPAKEGFIIDEPMAAAIFFFQHVGAKGRDASPLRREFERLLDERGKVHALIYDHGGGTLDVSVVEISQEKADGQARQRLAVLANCGDNLTGGEYIDLAVMREALKVCKALDGLFSADLIECPFQKLMQVKEARRWPALSLAAVLAARNEWIAAAEKAKIELSEGEVATFSVPASLCIRVTDGRVEEGGREFRWELTRQKLRDLCAGIFARSVDVVKGALRQCRLGEEQIDFVFHSGRSSLMPLVKQTVADLFRHLHGQEGRIVLEEETLKLCVARGAVRYASSRTRPGAKVFFDSERRTLPHSYGIAVNGMYGRAVFEPVIPAGSAYPVEATRSCGEGEVPENGYLALHFYQHKGIPAEEVDIEGNPSLRQIGSIHFNTLADGQPGAEITFRVGANRMLEVEADGQPVTITPPPVVDDQLWAG